MNMQAHMSGQFSGEVSSPAGNSMPHQNGDSIRMPMQNSGDCRLSIDHDFVEVRKSIQTKIFEFLMRRRSIGELSETKREGIAKRLEETLFRAATTKEEYMNLDTLENRIHVLIKCAQQRQRVSSSSSSIGTMIPTPAMAHSGNSSLMVPSSMGNSMISRSGGTWTNNGYQQSPSNSSIRSGGNSLICMKGVQRVTGQMIPTPGFNSNGNNTTNQSYMNMESSNNNSVGLSSVESATNVQTPQQKQNVGGQNRHILHNQVNHMGGGIRSSLQQKSYGFSNGALKNSVGPTGRNLQMVNGSGTSDGYPTAATHRSPSNSLPQHFDQHPHQMLQCDGYARNTADCGSGNVYVPTSTAGPVMNPQNLNRAGLQAIHKSTPMMTNQVADIKPSMDQSEKMGYQSHHSVRDNAVQYQKRSHTFGQPHLTPDVGSQAESEPGLECHDEALLLSQPFDQFQQNSTQDHSRATQLLNPPSSPQNIATSLGNTSQQMQQLLRQSQSVDMENDLTSPVGSQLKAVIQGQWHPRSQNMTQVSGNLSRVQNFQDDLHQRIGGQDQAQQKNLSSEGSAVNQTVAGPLNPSGGIFDPKFNRQIINKQRWLLLLMHARRCNHSPGKCPESNCIIVQNLLKHVQSCRVQPCLLPRCYQTKELIHHFKKCKDESCAICGPVRKFLQTVRVINPNSNSTFPPSSVNGPCNNNVKLSPSIIENSEDLQPSIKRMKLEPSVQSIGTENKSSEIKRKEHPRGVSCIPTNEEVTGVKGCPKVEVKKDDMESTYTQRLDEGFVLTTNPKCIAEQDSIKVEKVVVPTKQENATLPTESTAVTKCMKPKIKGVSMMEFFTLEQIREHIRGLRQWVGQSKAKAEKNQAMEHSMSENSCQLCAVERLAFELPPIYCSPCGARIKIKATFYTIRMGDARHCFCYPCHNEARGDTILVDGTAIPKAKLEKKKNDEKIEESWVQCDKCEAWQHQICALFNGRRNDDGQAEYTCPNCYIGEVERGERKPLPQSAVLGAKDLPRTILSDHIEQRLFKRLKEERQDRAMAHGKSYDEVPGAESLVVRVVLSVDKKLDVKQRFLEIFQAENYPTEFGYKSKVVLLFQRIEGVEVCLFGMYVQEFGSECDQPNHRRVYLSYLDSVKYFRPEIKAVTGEALRTFVYHEILIGYLDYCKKRGFTSCYIWACPPLKGEDYILYCHPEIQKTPKSDKLREWYLAMLRKASKENIVVNLTNLYDHFFLSSGECKAKVTAARLPYFDGDYWPGAAEDIIHQLCQEEDGRKHNKKGSTKKTVTKRSLKASGQVDFSGNASKDLLLMHRLGETISPMKEDFIMVHLQNACSHCCILMVVGKHWACDQCKNFQLCDKCYKIEQNVEEGERHPISQRVKHHLHPVEINEVALDTKDKDEVLESEFFDTRQAFLSLCQGNHYQYDTLRRAKHSSMMVLYHLHNPAAPAFVETCNKCHLDIESGQGWRCEVCPDFDVCDACYHKDGGIDHPHKLTNRPSIAESDDQNTEARQQRVLQLRKMLDLLVHASQCRSPICQYPNCRKVKNLFRHGLQCKVRASGGCTLCKQMWYLLQIHGRACKESQCNVPRCRDLKEHIRRLQQQSDNRRRAAVTEMMRQRATEVAGGRS